MHKMTELRGWERLLKKIIWAQLGEIKGKNILDFGSGEGITANHFAKDNHVVAIEPWGEMLKSRWKDYEYRQIQGDASELLKFEDNTFDVIICHNVLEYIDDKEKIINCLTRIDKQYKTVKDVLLKSANAGLNMSIVIHEIDKQVAALMGCAERGESEKILVISKNIEKLVRGYSAMIRKSSIASNSLSEIINTALDNYEFRFLDHGVKIITNVGQVNYVAKLAKAQAISIVANLLDNSIYWLGYSKRSKPTIAIFVTDQIDGYYSIVVSDNGPGFNIGTDVAVKPFISGKPDGIGMGIGLHIANEMMNMMGGKLMFYDKDDLDLPSEIINADAAKAIVALCFKK